MPCRMCVQIYSREYPLGYERLEDYVPIRLTLSYLDNNISFEQLYELFIIFSPRENRTILNIDLQQQFSFASRYSLLPSIFCSPFLAKRKLDHLVAHEVRFLRPQKVEIIETILDSDEPRSVRYRHTFLHTHCVTLLSLRPRDIGANTNTHPCRENFVTSYVGHATGFLTIFLQCAPQVFSIGAFHPTLRLR